MERSGDAVLLLDKIFVKHYWVYIITNYTDSVLYVGMTNNLERRLSEHKNKMLKGFSQKYNLKKLVHQEVYGDVNDAIAREKQIKKWNRSKKENLIKLHNPLFKDLSADWYNI